MPKVTNMWPQYLTAVMEGTHQVVELSTGGGLVGQQATQAAQPPQLLPHVVPQGRRVQVLLAALQTLSTL
jgi:hypothetical protein